MTKVSVIIPVYNTEKYLHKCLDSIINQTLQDIEIVIINDGSTDRSAEIIEEYKTKYPDQILVINQENSGQSVAKNKGIQACHGDYIAFLDSDDYMDSSMLKKMYDEITVNNFDMVYCDFYLEIGSNIEIKRVKNCSTQNELFIDCLVDQWNKMYRSDILKNYDIKFPESYFYEDTGWFIKTIPHVKSFTKINEPLIYHLVRPGSTMTEIDDSRVAMIFPVMKDLLSYYKRQGLYDTWKTELEYFFSKILLCSSMIRISRISNSLMRKQMIHRTFRVLSKWFPDYKNNNYIKHSKYKLYIRLMNKTTATIFVQGFRILNSGKRIISMYNVCK